MAVAIPEPFRVLRSKRRPVNNMSKHLNTDVSGKPFDETIVEHPPLRVDAYGALIWRGGYGNGNSKFGWEIGHKKPIPNGGRDEMENLQPVQWQNNRRNGDG
jgi:hypothetical protein